MAKQIWNHGSSSAEPERRGKTRDADLPKAFDGGNDEGERRAKVAKISRDMPKGGGRYHGDNRRY